MIKKFALLSLLMLLVISIIGATYTDRIEKGFVRYWIKGYTSAYIDIDSLATNHFVSAGNIISSGTFDPTITTTAAGGERGINLDITQATNALTGTLDAIYARATGYAANANAGRVQGVEIGARLPDGDGTKAVKEVVAGYFWADTKIGTVGTLRAVEASLDGGAGGTATLAVAFEAFNNTSAAYTTSIAYDVNEGSPTGRGAYTYDMRMQNGETMDNATNGTIQFISSVIKQAYDGTNYATWTIADDGGLTIATVDADAASADVIFNLDGDYLAIGGTAADNVTPELRIVNDADADASAITSETLTLALTPNGTPTNATWGFTSTQSAGYTFDKPINLGTSSSGITVTGTPDYVTELYGEIPTGAQTLANVGAINCRTTIKAASDITSSSFTTASYNRLEIEGGSTDLGFGWYNAVLGYIKNPDGSVDATESAIGAVMGLLNVGADWDAQSEAVNAAVIAGTYSPNTADIRKHYGFYVWKGGTLAFTHGLYIEANSATTAIGSGTVTNLLSLPAEGTAPVEAHVADENSTGRIKILVNGEIRYLYYYD